MRFLNIIAVLIIVSISSFADDKLLIFNQNSENYPQITFDVYNLINNQSLPIEKKDLELYENTIKIDNFNLIENQDTISDKNLFVFALDLSGSLTPELIQFYNRFITNFLAKLDLNNNRFAVIGFNNFVFNLASPDTNIQIVENLFANLKYFGSTNYDSLFLSEFNVLSYQNTPGEKYQVIILNDGSGTINESAAQKLIIDKNATIYSISFKSINIQSLKNIINNRNCLYFDNVMNLEQVSYFSDLVYLHSIGFKPYQVSYNSKSCYERNEIVALNVKHSTNNKFTFEIDASKLPYLEFIGSNSIDFGLVAKSSSKTVKLKVKPINMDIVVENILDDPTFKIAGISRNQILKQNNIYEIEVRYLPIDTNYIFKQLEIYHNACFKGEILVSGGVPDKKDLPKNLKLITPNGGEKINVYDSYLIKWEGILTTDTVSIELSTDNGVNWDLLTPKASGLSYNWLNPPNITTNLGLIKIKNFSKKDEFQQIKSLKGINGNIVGLKWSNNNNQLYTGSKDGFIRIWDTEKVEPLKTVLNGISNLNFFDISFDEKLILIIDDNRKSLKFYDIQTSLLINEYQIENEVNYLDWDDVSNNFVIGTTDGSVLIYEYPSQSPIFETNIQNNDVTVIKFSPLGNKIAIGTSQGNVFIYSINGQLINKFKNSDVAITDLSWNKSNSIISVSSTIEVVKIWDTETVTNVLQINEKSKPVNKTSWSPNLKYISTINADKSINIWKPDDGSLIYSFNLHSNIISDLAWNKDGTTIASGANEGEVLIWSVNDIPFERLLIQEDQSNEVFSLVKPSIQKHDVFLGQHSIGISFDSTITNFITNNGAIDLSLDSIKVWGDTRDNFKILNNFPVKLLSGSSFDLKINFTPTKKQVFVDSIVIFTKNTNYKSLLNAIGVANKINVEPKTLNFGDQKIGVKSNSKQIIIENLTSESIEIEDFFLDGSNGLSILDFSRNTLLPFEKRIFEAIFEPKNIGEVSSINYLKFSDINDANYIVLNGRGIAPKINIPTSIEFPKILCENEIKSELFFIKNYGNDILLIDTIYIQQTNSDFELISTLSDLAVLPNDSTPVTINFSKDLEGFSSATMIIKSNINANLKNEFNISLIGQKENILIEHVDKEVTLFAEVNQSKTIKTRIYNKSTIPIIIEPFFDNNNFKIISKLPILIIPNDSIDLEIELQPISQSGLASSVLNIKDTCNNIYSINFNAYIGLKNAKISIESELFFDTLFCKNVSNPKSIFLKNIGDVPLVIGDIVFDNEGQDNFSISKNISKKILQKDEVDSIQVYVDAVEIGKIDSELRIYSNAENTLDGFSSVKLNSYIAFSSVKPENDTLYFNDLFENKVYHQKIKVKNNGNTNLLWEYPRYGDFFVIDSVNPMITLPNEESTFFITFLGGVSPNTYYQDYFFDNTCSDEQKIVFSANVNKKAALGIKAGTIHSAPGDTVELPIYLYLKESNSFPIVDHYECDLSFNGTLLIPLDYESSLDDDLNRKVTLKLNPLPDIDGVIAKIRFVSYLGNADSTIISVSNSKVIGGDSFAIEETNGLFYLDSVCYVGGARLIGSTGVLRLFPNYPNPASNFTIIPFSIIERGKYNLEIYDLLSNSISKIDLGVLFPGIYEISVDLSKFSAGNYFYLLRTPSTILIRKMTINR